MGGEAKKPNYSGAKRRQSEGPRRQSSCEAVVPGRASGAKRLARRSKFVNDRKACTAVLACKGPDANLRQEDLETVHEVWIEEIAGEDVRMDGTSMSESKFNERYTAEERAKLHIKKDVGKNVKSGELENIGRHVKPCPNKQAVIGL